MDPNVIEAAMLAEAKKGVVTSAQWLTSKQIIEKAVFNGSSPSAWERSGLIYSIRHQNADYFPVYGLEKDLSFPLPAMKAVIAALDLQSDSWQFAFWFAAANSYLDGKRP